MAKDSDLPKWISYEPETGLFRLLDWTSIRKTVGLVMNWNEERRQRSGRLVRVTSISLHGRHYAAGRLAWFLMNGGWPPAEIDHRDNDGWNNCWSNIRLATRSQNQANTRCYSSSTTGIKGVFWSGSISRPYRVQIQKDGRRISLGRFETKQEAARVYAEAAEAMHGEYARAA